MVSNVVKTIVLFVMCHMTGDYLFQSDFIAKTKGSNWYHLFVHAVLYCVPFAAVFGLTWQLAVIFAVHMIVDPLKARWQKIGYVQDQVCHLLCVVFYVVWG